MTNITINNTNLTCILQQDNEISKNKCYTGIFSKSDNALKFEEAIRKGRAPRNPKLFDGKYITLVRKTNGKYQIHAKTLRIEPDFNPSDVAFGYFQEVSSALKFIN
ncbi:MAG: hypothetical protein MR717_04420 [Prevotella sp.]|nr:hypothetical protein [Prevotella sp.]